MKIAYIKRGKIKLFFILLLFALSIICGLHGMRDYAKTLHTNNNLPIYCTDNDKREIALTINCAWGAEDIGKILEILDSYDVKATFFVLGTWVQANPDELVEIYNSGHEIGNHSYSHKLPSRSSDSQLMEEIEKCNQAICDVIGVTPYLYRAPSGDNTKNILRIAENMGMFNIKWSVDSIDWRKDMTKSDIINRVLGRTESGSILLFHNDTQYICDVLPVIIESLQKQDYKFVKVSELIYLEDYYIDSTGRQCKS